MNNIYKTLIASIGIICAMQARATNPQPTDTEEPQGALTEIYLQAPNGKYLSNVNGILALSDTKEDFAVTSFKGMFPSFNFQCKSNQKYIKSVVVDNQFVFNFGDAPYTSVTLAVYKINEDKTGCTRVADVTPGNYIIYGIASGSKMGFMSNTEAAGVGMEGLFKMFIPNSENVNYDADYNNTLWTITQVPGSVTGINEIAADNHEVYYDLMGRQVENPQSGNLYIMTRGNKTIKVIK